ncbi:hypothetical protein TNCV_4996431 [Trichonephila clavipes]|nr:hypothetical protein TNCV_4996431 [Trichonephila clavipes]
MVAKVAEWTANLVAKSDANLALSPSTHSIALITYETPSSSFQSCRSPTSTVYRQYSPDNNVCAIRHAQKRSEQNTVYLAAWTLSRPVQSVHPIAIILINDGPRNKKSGKWRSPPNGNNDPIRKIATT